ncbi:MAG: SHOCT domain-containing protein [Pseudomonadota bacterium]
MAVADELAKLGEMRQAGTLSEEEYEAAKAKVLAPAPSASSGVWTFLALDAAFSLVFWVILAVIFFGSLGALHFFGDDMDFMTSLLVLGPIFCIGVLSAAASQFDGMDFATPSLMLGSAAVLGIGGVLAMIALPLMIVFLVIAAIGAAITWFGDLFG